MNVQMKAAVVLASGVLAGLMATVPLSQAFAAPDANPTQQDPRIGQRSTQPSTSRSRHAPDQLLDRDGAGRLGGTPTSGTGPRD